VENRISRLAALHPGEKGRIVGVYVRDGMGQRLKDMGFEPGVEIECVLESPFGDPAAYFIKGTLIAVRKEDAEKIEVEMIFFREPQCV